MVAVFALGGLRLGLQPVADNSTFVHLRTGIDMLDTWHIPRSDPYSFTAHGHPWVVQSWLASALYGSAYHIGGWLFGPAGRLHLFVTLNGILLAVLAAVVARLARTGAAVRTMASAGVAVGLGAVYWSPRPLIFGLLGLALLITVVEERANPLWLLPIMWVWVNTHGSFPLGVAWLGARIVGEAIDTRTLVRRLWPYFGALVAGLALGAVNPLGPSLLAFPLKVGEKLQVFKTIIEWRSPDFQATNNLIALVLLSLALLIMARSRIPWAYALPSVGIIAGALFSLRNMAPAAVVLAPTLAYALRPRAGAATVPLPTADPADPADPVAAPAEPVAPGPARPPPVLNNLIAAALAAAGLLFVIAGSQGPALNLRMYPTRAQAWMAARGLFDPARHRVAEQDIVGCYFILQRGSEGRVFIDDRVDMYPVRVSQDYQTLLGAQPGSPAVLDRYHVDTVVWQKRLGLRDVLVDHGGWRVSYSGKAWVVLTRTPALPHPA